MARSRVRKAEAARPRPEATVRGQKPALAMAQFPIVAVGASAGGLEACGKLLSGLPAGTGMAFILIQHLDPTHDSMLVELLARHTSMTVREATEGMRLESDHLFVIPPGTYLSVSAGVLRLSRPQAPRGARLPFDFLLRSLAKDVGPRAVCVVLSGMGADGSLGLRAIKEAGGHVIAQDPDEAAFGGMPHNAVLTGVVDQVLPLEKIAAALVDLDPPTGHAPVGPSANASSHDGLAEIIDLLRARTTHDFTLYKRGTLERRVERRMALAAIKTDGHASVSGRPARRHR